MTHVARLGAAFAIASLAALVPLHAQQRQQQQQNVPPPRTADGHPDLSGMWGGGGGGGGGGDKPDEKGNLTVLFKQRPRSEHQQNPGKRAQAAKLGRDSRVE